jgi:hypothetical protein
VDLDISNEYVTFICEGSRSRHPEDIHPSHYNIPENLNLLLLLENFREFLSTNQSRMVTFVSVRIPTI